MSDEDSDRSWQAASDDDAAQLSEMIGAAEEPQPPEHEDDGSNPF